MALTIIERICGFLGHPTETFRNTKTDTVKAAFLYYTLILLLNAVLSVIIAILIIRGIHLGSSAIGGSVWMGLPGAFFSTLVEGFILLFVGGLWLHLLVYIVGGRKQIDQTFKAFMYGATPYLLLGWMPIVNLIAGIWAISIGIIGIRELHEISTRRAVFAGLIWAISFGIIFIALIYGFVSF
ncbi:YIP1 family protein [Methanogenium marinum]|uniref:YIP1 family protein n=1 Tax=Methanogenium marinum TaxID=348610 RepID=A0A9Q4KMF9_9EURY|nr:YIP1 family protein [Methanogenium marinum]MDE4907158.1 YIP1 family protein [Methanogenium marinum]